MFLNIFLIVLGYIIGSIPTGYLIAKYFGKINIKEHGSGNIGATNITRIMGKKYGVFTLLGDGIKAILYILFVKYILKHLYPGDGKTYLFLICIVSLAILLGNCYSVFLGFDGGKGGVTTYGIFLPLTPMPSIIAIFSYAVLARFTKRSAAGTLASVIVLPIAIYLLTEQDVLPYYFTLALIFLVIVWIRHKKNIRELYTCIVR